MSENSYAWLIVSGWLIGLATGLVIGGAYL